MPCSEALDTQIVDSPAVSCFDVLFVVMEAAEDISPPSGARTISLVTTIGSLHLIAQFQHKKPLDM